MSPFKKFILCLSPAVLAALLLPVGEFIGPFAGDLLIFLIVSGALISGTCVGGVFFRAIEPKEQWTVAKYFLGVFLFLGVVIVYLALAVAGGCGLAASMLDASGTYMR